MQIFLIKSIPRSAFVATNYLFCLEDKSLTAEYVPRLQAQSYFLSKHLTLEEQ
jgi:hypothetical protein